MAAEPMKAEELKFTPFVEGKIRVWFRMIDVGHDGFMNQDDFLSIAERFVRVRALFCYYK